MKLKKIDITGLYENYLANLLIKSHTIGDLRDEDDFLNVKYHVMQTLSFVKIIILNTKTTDEEKITLIDKISKDLDKFKIKK